MQKMDAAKLKSFWFRYHRRLLIGVSALFFVLLAIILTGAFFLPGFIKSKAEQAVAEEIHRKLSIQDVGFNPFSQSLTLKGVTLSERDGEALFVSFDRLYVHFSPVSLVTLSPVVKEIVLENPYVHLSRVNENEYNISDLVEMAMQPTDPDKKPFLYSLNNIQIDGGKIVFDDHPKKAHHEVTELKIHIPSISSRPSRVETFVEPQLSALVNGTKMELSGKTRPFAKDKETVFNLALGDIELSPYMAYLPYRPAFHLTKGKLGFDLNLHFTERADQSPDLDISGTAQIDSLQLTDRDKKPMVGWGKLALVLDKNAIFAGDYRIAKVTVSKPDIHIVSAANGRLNLMDLAPLPEKSGQAKPAPHESGKKEKSAPLKLALKAFAVQDAKVAYTDNSANMPYTMTADHVDLTVDDVAVDMGENKASIGKVASNRADWEMALKKAQRSGRSSGAAKSSGAPGLEVDVGSVDISGWSAHLQNNNLKKPLGAKITGLTVSMQDISTKAGQTSSVKLSADVDKKGHIAVEGKVRATPLLADFAVDLKHVNIVAVQQYIDEYVNLTLRRADVSARGHLSVSASKQGTLVGEYRGDMGIANLLTTDQIKNDPFVQWKDLSIREMHVRLSPFSLAAKRADVNGFFARLILSSEGRLNLQDVLRSQAGGKKSLTESEEHPGDAAKAETSSPATAPQKTAEAAAQPEPMAQPASAVSPAQAVQEKTETKPDKKETAAQSKTGTPSPGGAAPAAQAAGSLPPIRIDRFKMTNGRVLYTDNFIKPRYTADMNNVQGTITRISSTDNAIAVVDVKGRVNGAPLVIAGSINPFNPALSLELQGHVKGMELAQFSSYSTKYVGYGIEKGKLSFDVQYKVENGELHAQNRLILDQLTFGEKSEGKPVVSLPVKFAVNLLKDANGVIDVELPVSGTLNDPQFSIGGIIFRVVVNLIKKVVTSPFTALASAFGGGEELSWLEFDPGKADITDQGTQRLATLAKALQGRPGLMLDVTGNYDRERDKEGLGRIALDRKVRELRRKEMGAEGEDVPLSQIKVSDEAYLKLLKQVYSEGDFKKPRNFIGFPKSMSAAEMEKLISQSFPVSDDDFMSLADKRAANVKAWLIDKGGVPEARIFIRASKSRTGEHASRVDFSLH